MMTVQYNSTLLVRCIFLGTFHLLGKDGGREGGGKGGWVAGCVSSVPLVCMSEITTEQY